MKTSGQVIKDYTSAYPNPIKIKAGESLIISREKTSKWKGWLWCTNPLNISGWVPETYLEIVDDKSGRALCDYDAIELTVVTGEQLKVIEEESGWLLCINKNGARGWIPKKHIRFNST